MSKIPAQNDNQNSPPSDEKKGPVAIKVTAKPATLWTVASLILGALVFPDCTSVQHPDRRVTTDIIQAGGMRLLLELDDSKDFQEEAAALEKEVKDLPKEYAHIGFGFTLYILMMNVLKSFGGVRGLVEHLDELETATREATVEDYIQSKEEQENAPAAFAREGIPPLRGPGLDVFLRVVGLTRADLENPEELPIEDIPALRERARQKAEGRLN